MDAQEFRESTKTVSNLIVDYMEKVPNMNLGNKVKPGFLENKMEDACPNNGSHFVAIMRDFEKIMQGVQHRASPHFHSELPMGNSYPSLVSEMLIAGLNNVSLNWEASPAATELEVIVLNWLAKMINLPEEFSLSKKHSGGGVLQNTCTESTLLSLLSARTRAIEHYRTTNDDDKSSDTTIIKKLIFYSSSLAKTTANLVSQLTDIKVRHLVPNNAGQITTDTLKSAFEEDTEKGLTPIMYMSSMASDDARMMSYDDLTEVGPLCQQHNVWLHIDANHSGMALICPELRAMSRGIEYADSITVGLHSLLMSQDVVAYWIKEGSLLTTALSVDPLYLRHKHVGSVHDYMNWQIGTGRKFKALKVWITLKSFGLEGLQNAVREQVIMARRMEEFITKDNRFEVIACHLGVVTFRLRNDQGQSKELHQKITQNGRISLGAQEIDNKFCLQFIVNQNMQQGDVAFAWEEIKANI